MIIVIVAALIIILAFGLVVLVGAPYVPTLAQTGTEAIKMLGLKKGQTMYDLGCGDGTMLRLAAKAGLRAEGYEINPILVLVARLRTLRFAGRVKVHWGNFWQADLGRADGVYVFLLNRYMKRLDKKLSAELKAGTKFVSYAFPIPGKMPYKKSGALYLYKY